MEEKKTIVVTRTEHINMYETELILDDVFVTESEMEAKGHIFDMFLNLKNIFKIFNGERKPGGASSSSYYQN